MENPKLEEMGSGYLNSICEPEEKGAQKISVAHQIYGLEYAGQKADGFVVDIERFSSHLTDKDVNANSRVTLQRSLSRKGSTQRGGEKKSNWGINNDNNLVATSPRAAALPGGSTTEKAMAVTVGATDHSVNPQLHNAITIMTVCSGSATAAESKISGRRFSFRRSSPSWTIDPRRLLFFFATLSSMGTILLIYFTLSMSKLNGDDSGLN